MIAASRCGTRTLRNASSTLTVSVIARMAPSRSAIGNGRPRPQAATAAVARSVTATAGPASARIGRAAARMLTSSAESAPWKTSIGRKTSSTTAGSIGVSGRTFISTSSKPDDDEGDVVGDADPLGGAGDGRADRQHEEQLLEVFTHG